MADVIMINKVNSLPGMKPAYDQAEKLRKVVGENVPILFANSVVVPEARGLSTEEAAQLVKGKRVLVIDDGPTLTHGGMPFGAGLVLAKDLGAGEIVDPHPYAKGSLAGVLQKFTHLDRVLPAMGYGAQQIKDLEATVRDVDCDCVIVGTPINLASVIDLSGKPWVRACYNLELLSEHKQQFDAAVESIL